MTPLVWLGVAVLGAVGAVLRFVVDGIVASRVGGDFPAGTLVVNATGAVALGLLVGLSVSADVSVLVGTAAIGSYTTVSTWMLETHRLLESGQSRSAALNGLVSLALGLGAAALGRVIGSHL